MVKKIVILFFIFASVPSLQAKSKLNLAEKVNLLFEVNPKSKYKKYVIEELKGLLYNTKKIR